MSMNVEHALREALAHHQAGRFAEAERIYRQILSENPNQPDALNLLGMLAHQIARHAPAAELIARAVALAPKIPEFHNNLAGVLRALGQVDDAVASSRRALELRPDFAEAHNNLAITLEQQGRLVEAESSCRRALQLSPDLAAAWVNLASVLSKQNRLAEAAVCCERAIEIQGDLPEAYHNLANLLSRMNRLDEAADRARRAIQLRPDFVEALLELGAILGQQKKYSDAADVCRRALQLCPDLALAHHNLAACLLELGDAEQALSHWRRAIELQPNNTDIYNQLAVALDKLARFDESLVYYRKIVELRPQSPDAHWNLSLTLLTLGHFEEGWKHFEWRWRCATFTSPPRYFTQPKWDGSDLRGRTILLHAEQGFGDMIQFVRYAPLVAQRFGGAVALECPREVFSLFQSVAGVNPLVMFGQELPPFDVHCPLMSLAGLFRTRLDNIPAQCPYLSADPIKVEQWRERLGQFDGLKVGLAWAGRPTHPHDRARSISPATLAPLAAVEGVRFISLQKGPAATQITNAPQLNLIDHTQHIEDFSDTAALIANLDLIISVDTAIVHLAGALAKPVWTLVPFSPDWRWLMDRADSPWYPTMRLFRQQRPGDWPEVIARVVDALAATAHEP